MIYDEVTIDFIIEKVKELEVKDDPEIGLDFYDGRYCAFEKVLHMLQNIKKIKAIN